MIRSAILFTAAMLTVTSCASDKGFETTQSFAPAEFNISDVFVNMQDGVENSNRIRKLMRGASRNTAKVYNKTIGSESETYPLEIEVSEVNYRNPSSSATSGDRTYIKYTATLREEASGQVFRSLPVTYYHISPSSLSTDEAKKNAEKNMIRISIKNAFARLYGMQTVPQAVQTHFNTNDIFSGKEIPTRKTAPKPTAPRITPIVKAPEPIVPQIVEVKPVVEPEPIVIAAPEVTIIDNVSATGEPKVITCVVC